MKRKRINKVTMFNAVGSVTVHSGSKMNKRLENLNETVTSLLIKENQGRFYTPSFSLTTKEADTFIKAGIEESIFSD
jgi:hypothetical protein